MPNYIIYEIPGIGVGKVITDNLTEEEVRNKILESNIRCPHCGLEGRVIEIKPHAENCSMKVRN